MRGKTGTSTTLIRMETGQHVLHVFEDGSTGSQIPSHHPQPSLDGSGIQVSRAGPGLGESLEHSPLGSIRNGDIISSPPLDRMIPTYLP